MPAAAAGGALGCGSARAPAPAAAGTASDASCEFRHGQRRTNPADCTPERGGAQVLSGNPYGNTAPASGRRIGRLDLVLAVGCLGMLAAVAVPRQQVLTARSLRTETGALAESVRSAALLGHSLWQAQGEPPVLQTGRGRIEIINGYPAAEDLALLLEPAEVMAFDHTKGTWQHRERGDDSPCGVAYAPPLASTQEPVVRLRVSGCGL